MGEAISQRRISCDSLERGKALGYPVRVEVSHHLR